MKLSRLWIGMLTRNIEDAGTDNDIVLTINVDGVDVLNHTFSENTFQKEQERGQANVYQLDVSRNGIEVQGLTDSSIRIGIRGDDAWRPEHVVVWGEVSTLRLFETDIIPLAMELDIVTVLSTDSGEGLSTIPIRLIRRGSSHTVIRRLLMLMTTQPEGRDSDSIFTEVNPVFGTRDPLEIQVVSRNGLAALSEFANTSQDDHSSGVANFYTAPVIVPFASRDLDVDALTLRVKGIDDWWPANFFLFGLDTLVGRPNFLIPLSHIPQWPLLGVMHADAASAAAQATLPLIRRSDVLVDGTLTGEAVFATLRSVESSQRRLVALLEELVSHSAVDGLNAQPGARQE